jgi:MtN3 and saliva related transmembrane protein
MKTIETIGFVAAILTTGAFFPQVVKSWRSRSTEDLSLPMYLMMSSGTLLWLIYGILIANFPLILANGFSTLFCCIIFYFKIVELIKQKNTTVNSH